MEDGLRLFSPTGFEIQGTYELVPGAASVVFIEGEPGYDHDGSGTEMFWDGAETQSIGDSSLFTDEDGCDWLRHHLIAAVYDDGDDVWDDPQPLSEATLELFREEMRIGEALEAAKKFSRSMDANKALDPVLAAIKGAASAAVIKLSEFYEEAKSASIAARDKELSAR